MAKTTNEVSRRGFIGAIGAAAATAAAAAAAAHPALALGAPTAAVGLRWTTALEAWPDAVAEMKAATDAIVARFRPAYLAEVRRFAEELRPRFESGELYGYRSEDEDGMDRLENLCAERFGVEVRQVPDDVRYYVGDEETANMINAVSPSAPHWEPESEWNHPGYCAKACIAFDVIAVARALGFYEPTPDEGPSAEQIAWVHEVLP